MAKVKKSKDYTPRPPKAKERKLYDGEYVTWLDVPNNLMSFWVLTDEERVKSLAPDWKRMWPLTAAMIKLQAGNERGIFVHEQHGAEHWHEWADRPPTWMDPHLFIQMALADERVQKVLRVSFSRNDPDAGFRLLPLFQDVLDTQYLPFLIERFTEEAAPLLAEWLLRYHATQQLDLLAAAKESKRKARRTSGE
jgi:hypothetical protein